MPGDEGDGFMLDDRERLPWLEPAEPYEEIQPVPIQKVIALVLLGLILLAVIVGGGWWLKSRMQAPQSGDVVAIVGGRETGLDGFNRALDARRAIGSLAKPVVYLAALEAGHKPDDTIVDEPVTIGGWSPRNSSGHFSGPMTLRTAFAYSVNTIAAKLGQEVGFATVADMARRFGISTPIDTNPAMVLGGPALCVAGVALFRARLGAIRLRQDPQHQGATP